MLITSSISSRSFVAAFLVALLISAFFVFQPLASQALTLSCAGNQPPIAVIEPEDLIIEIGESVMFSAAGSSDPDISASRFNRVSRLGSRLRTSQQQLSFAWWVTGTGITATGETFKFTPLDTGIFVVRLDVSDGCDTTRTSTILRVFEPEQPVPEAGKPIIKKLNISSNRLVNSAGLELFRFSITAPPTNDIGFYKASFDIATDTVFVRSLELWETDINGFANLLNLTFNAPREVDETIIPSDSSGGTHRVNILIDTGFDGVSSGGEFRVISAGTTRYYKLTASTANSVNGSTVTTKLLSDSIFPFSSAQSAIHVDESDNDNFIWSDLHFGNSSTTATNTAEWSNGFEVFETSRPEILDRPAPAPEPEPEPEPDFHFNIRSIRRSR